jgi:hypothetical protein
MRFSVLFIAFAISVSARAGAAAPTITVNGTAELKAALASLQSGTTLKIAPGDYSGGHYVRNVAGLVIEALDSSRPPVFKGGSEGWHFTKCEGLTLRNITVSGQSSNGINLDDGGELDRSVKGVTLEGLRIQDIGPSGNHDAIKVSGLENLTISRCAIEGWGGEAIDFVGCRKSLITGCEIKGKQGFSSATGIQLKGGCSEITVEKCRFINAGTRPINLGGSTGATYFRPAGVKYEAHNLTARDNIFEGGTCAVAFTGVDGATFTGNTILFPSKWIFRILQETTTEGFAVCGNVKINGNRIVFRRSEVKVDINIGANTAPQTFAFENNRWFAEDQPAKSKPTLPVAETAGTYGVDPR